MVKEYKEVVQYNTFEQVGDNQESTVICFKIIANF